MTYTLTRQGRAFEQVAEAIQRWGSQLVADRPGLPTARPAADAARRSRAR